MIELRETETLNSRGDFMPARGQQQPIAGARLIVVYLLCCNSAIAVGKDQWDGKAPLRCEECNQSYFIDDHAKMLPVTR